MDENAADNRLYFPSVISSVSANQIEQQLLWRRIHLFSLSLKSRAAEVTFDSCYGNDSSPFIASKQATTPAIPLNSISVSLSKQFIVHSSLTRCQFVSEANRIVYSA